MKKIYILYLLSLLAVCNAELDEIIFHHFQKFIKNYNKKYQSINEYFVRFEVFKRNIMSSISSEKKSYKTGITTFSDLTKEEFTKTYLNLDYNAMAISNFNPTFKKIKNDAPDSFDWRDYNVISPIKDQGYCSASWAFSVIGNLESLYAIEKKVFKSLSEQMLIDCDSTDSGCAGGSLLSAYNWLKKNGGIMYEVDYPYRGVRQTCKSDKSKYADMLITGYKILSSSSTWSVFNEDDMKEYLYANNPLAIGINGDPLQTYTSGIIDLPSDKCPSSGLNHAVLLVGYGTDSSSSKDYWILKNWWGRTWGESGYFRLRRGNKTCGVDSYVTTAVVAF